MQIYLLENYHLVKQTSKDSYKYAAILERNQNKKPFNRTFASTSVFPSKTEKVFIKGAETSKGGRHFKINSRKVRIEYVLKNPVYASHFKVKLLLKTNFLKKYFTKTRMTIGIIASGESIVFHYDINDLGDLGTVKTELQGIFVPRKDLIKKTDKVWIELNTPEPYLIPEEFEVLELTALLDERIGL